MSEDSEDRGGRNIVRIATLVAGAVVALLQPIILTGGSWVLEEVHATGIALGKLEDRSAESIMSIANLDAKAQATAVSLAALQAQMVALHSAMESRTDDRWRKSDDLASQSAIRAEFQLALVKQSNEIDKQSTLIKDLIDRIAKLERAALRGDDFSK